MDTKPSISGRQEADENATRQMDTEMRVFLNKLMDDLTELLGTQDFGMGQTADMNCQLLGQMQNGVFVPGGIFWFNCNAGLGEWSLMLSFYLKDRQDLMEVGTAGSLEHLLEWVSKAQTEPSLRPVSRKLIMLVAYGLEQTLARDTGKTRKPH